MANINQVSTTPAETGDYVSFTHIEGDYQCSDSVNGTGFADSMPDREFLLLVPKGKVANISASLTVDDWGSLRITQVEDLTGRNYSMPSRYLLLLSPDISPAGPRGGHEKWTQSRKMKLSAGTYIITISHQNVDYSPEYDSRFNEAICQYSIDITYSDVKGRLIFIDFDFGERTALNYAFDPYQIKDNATEADINKMQIPCGYTFFGIGTAYKDDGTSYSFRIQTGGLRTQSKLMPIPTVEDLRNNYDATRWYDTACPAMACSMSTAATGGTKGYAISFSYPTIREDIKLHYKEYGKGSNGCISTSDSWNLLVKDLAEANVSSIPISVNYTDVLMPDYNRNPKNYVANPPQI